MAMASVLQVFSFTDGVPNSLIFDSQGDLFGTTSAGGPMF
jgi:hypothetical protein